ncbi:zf-HC2 domain-containing protein [Actinophytocola sp.]|uniref:zf-HC2 domain-containing protein n=1 Tax=Actinophytocola sp. TaxID=1872138 RepID=UPI002D5EB6D6|nr:zf-HC2 domain-containing protein [Actinophytocola sp.]HYQ65265.1 zf-HC2 domain-containing protein [Actinophytocola sp.]
MDCDTCREALSARLDGETEPASPDEHLGSCPECQDWYVAATTLTGSWGAEPPAPDLTDAVLGRVEPRDGLLGSPRWQPR